MLIPDHTVWSSNAFLCNDCYAEWKESGIPNLRNFIRHRLYGYRETLGGHGEEVESPREEREVATSQKGTGLESSYEERETKQYKDSEKKTTGDNLGTILVVGVILFFIIFILWLIRS